MTADGTLFIRNVELAGSPGLDVKLENGRIKAIGRRLAGYGAEVDGRGGALIPGLIDHHVHLLGRGGAGGLAAAGRHPIRIGTRITLHDRRGRSRRRRLDQGYGATMSGWLACSRGTTSTPSPPTIPSGFSIKAGCSGC